MFTYIETVLMSFVNILSLEVFVFVASIIEEVIAPIPSPTVMVVAGSVAQLQERALFFLIPLAIIGALGKVIGALFVYVISDKAEDFVLRRFGNFFNVSHEDVEAFGKRLGNGKRDYVLLTVLRALPFIPSVLLSVGSGVLKIPLPLFIFSTFFGTIIRDGFYLYAVFVGTEMLSAFVTQTSHMETYVEVFAAVVVISILVRMYFLKKKNRLQ